jgi:hypothetical protein
VSMDAWVWFGMISFSVLVDLGMDVALPRRCRFRSGFVLRSAAWRTIVPFGRAWPYTARGVGVVPECTGPMRNGRPVRPYGRQSTD